jgi:hypothetical protein
MLRPTGGNDGPWKSLRDFNIPTASATTAPTRLSNNWTLSREHSWEDHFFNACGDDRKQRSFKRESLAIT